MMKRPQSCELNAKRRRVIIREAWEGNIDQWKQIHVAVTGPEGTAVNVFDLVIRT